MTLIEKDLVSDSAKKRLWKVLWGLCIFLLLIELFVERHGHFGDHSLDSYFGFYGLLGFISAFICLLISKVIGLVLTVKENYYDRDII